MLRCAELGLRREDLEEFTQGMVYDLLIERENDREKYPIKGQPGTLASFLEGGQKRGK